MNQQLKNVQPKQKKPRNSLSSPITIDRKDCFWKPFRATGSLANDYALTITIFSTQTKKLEIFTIILDRREWLLKTMSRYCPFS